MPLAAVSTRPAGPAGRDNARDLDLLGRIAHGDRQAFEAFYGEYHGRLARFLARLTSNDALIDEVVNETLWLVWRNAKAFRGSSQVSTWVLGIAWRCGLKALRRNGGDSLETTSEPGDSPASQPFAEHETRDWIHEGLRQLPFEQRAALTLVYYFGHSLEEIAAIMDCPVGTVKGRLFHARIKLRNLLPALGGFEPGEHRESH